MLEETVRRAQAGDAEAFTELVRGYQDAVFGAAWQRVLDFEAARDIAQEAFVRAYERLGDLRDAAAFPGWLLRICRNLAVSWRRSPERDLEALDAAEAITDDPADRVAIRDLVSRALSALPEDNRLALTLFLVNGYSYREVASLTEVPVATVRGRIARSRRQLAAEVLAMTEETLKSEAPDEQFTAETLQRIEILSREQRWDELSEVAEQLVEQRPESALPWLWRGRALVGMMRLDDGQTAFQRALALDAELLEARISLAEATPDAAEREDLLREAIPVLNARIEEEPDEVHWRLRRADVLAQAGDFSSCEAELRRIIELYPNNGMAHLMLARILHKPEQYEDAETAYRQAIALMPDSVGALTQLAWLCALQDRPDEALELLDRAEAINPSAQTAHGVRAAVLQGMGRLDDALAAAEHGSHIYRGRILHQMGRAPDDVMEALDAAVQATSPPSFSALVCRAEMLLKFERWEDALRDLTQAIAMNPHDSIAFFFAAKANYELGRYEEAWQDIRKSEELGAERGWTVPEDFLTKLREAMPEPPDDAGVRE